MGQALTILLLAVVCAAALARFVRAGRRRRDAERRAAGAARRQAGEDELRRRLQRLKDGDDVLAKTRDAIAGDPKRAARTLSKMMQSKD